MIIGGNEMEQPKYILFSPVGTTDPISIVPDENGGAPIYDGSCLHIVRYYHPVKVYIYYTEEMEERENKYHVFSKAIRHVSPACEIEPIPSKIVEAHLYDEYLKHLPNCLLKIHDENPDSTILLNLSSGTTALKGIMAILATEYPWCKGIQVSTPARKSNNRGIKFSDEEKISRLAESEDEKPGNAPNRCTEPALKIIHFYQLRHQLTSLIEHYDYYGASYVADSNRDLLDSEAVDLIKCCKLRVQLNIESAKRVLPAEQRDKVFPLPEEQEKLVEHLLAMDIDVRQGNFSSFVLKITPFLSEFLYRYILHNIDLPLEKSRAIFEEKGIRKICNKIIEKKMPDLYNYLEDQVENFYKGKKANPIYPIFMWHILNYAMEKNKAKNMEMHKRLMHKRLMRRAVNKDKSIMEKLNKLRDVTAHSIQDCDENYIDWETGITPQYMIDDFWDMLALFYGDSIKEQCHSYRKINKQIQEALASPDDAG